MANIRIEGACTIVTANTDTDILTVGAAQPCSTLTDKGKVVAIDATNYGTVTATVIVTWQPTGAGAVAKYRMYAKIPPLTTVALLPIGSVRYVTSADKFVAQSDKTTVYVQISGIGE